VDLTQWIEDNLVGPGNITRVITYPYDLLNRLTGANYSTGEPSIAIAAFLYSSDLLNQQMLGWT
jgi:hypothetical protein